MERLIMAQDGPTEELMRRLLSAVSSQASADTLVREAKAAAEDEVRELLKSAFKATLLRQATQRLEEANSARRPTVEQETEPRMATPGAGSYLYAITLADSPTLPPAAG